MKCDCEACQGTGQIECPECDGTGTDETSIVNIKLNKDDPRHDALMEIQTDALRARQQTDALCKMKPHRAGSYHLQLRSTLLILNREADAVS